MSRDIFEEDSNRPVEGPAWRRRAYEVVFHAEDPVAKAFDVILLGAILLSVVVVMLESVESYSLRYGSLLFGLEWLFTLLFTAEYVVRLISVRNKSRYALSFFGLIDLFTILPSYVSLVFPGAQGLAVLRVLRVLRVFRVLKLVQYMGEARILGRALMASRYKITVFLITVTSLTVVLGSLMFLIEGGRSGFTSIPTSIYWAIVTLTTVGFGDITPQTPLGQFLASIIMLLGYGILAVPMGIMSVEIARASSEASEPLGGRAPGWGTGGEETSPRCPQCGRHDHPPQAEFCYGCGHALNSNASPSDQRP